MMTNPAFVQSLSAELHAFGEAYRADRSLLRFQYHRLDELQTRLDELALPMREFDSEWVPDIALQDFFGAEPAPASIGILRRPCLCTLMPVLRMIAADEIL